MWDPLWHLQHEESLPKETNFEPDEGIRGGYGRSIEMMLQD